MFTKKDLIHENNELKSRLEFAEKWMRREVAVSINRIQREKSTKSTRKSLSNVFEAEWLDILTGRILDQFDDSLSNAPKYTIERLIDAEIYWQTLQRYPQMDALPIVLAYQKIFDAWIEEKLIAPYRREMQHTHIGALIRNLDIDIINILTKNYSLSIGRLYQILTIVRSSGHEISPVTQSLIVYWQKEIPNILSILISDECFIIFSCLIELEIFSRKRHEGKVNYSDAKKMREIMVDASDTKSFLEMIFSV